MNTAQLLEAGIGLVNDQSAPQGPSAGASTPVAPAGGPASLLKVAAQIPSADKYMQQAAGRADWFPDIDKAQGFNAPEGPQIKTQTHGQTVNKSLEGIGGMIGGAVNYPITRGQRQIANWTDRLGWTTGDWARRNQELESNVAHMRHGAHQAAYPRWSTAYADLKRDAIAGMDPESAQHRDATAVGELEEGARRLLPWVAGTGRAGLAGRGAGAAHQIAEPFVSPLVKRLTGAFTDTSAQDQVYQRLTPEQQDVLHQHKNVGIDERSTGAQRDAAMADVNRRLLEGDPSVLRPPQARTPQRQPTQPQWQPMSADARQRHIADFQQAMFADMRKHPFYANKADAEIDAKIVEFMGQPDVVAQLLERYAPALLQDLRGQPMHGGSGMEKQQHDVKGIFKAAQVPAIPQVPEVAGAAPVGVPPKFTADMLLNPEPVPAPNAQPVPMPQAQPDPNVPPPVQMPQAVPDPNVPQPVPMPQEVPPGGQPGPEASVPPVPAPAPEPGMPPGAAQAPGPEAQQPAQEPLPADLPHRPSPFAAGQEAAQAQAEPVAPAAPQAPGQAELMKWQRPQEELRALFTDVREGIKNGSLKHDSPEGQKVIKEAMQAGMASVALQINPEDPVGELGRMWAKAEIDGWDADDIHRMVSTRSAELGLDPRDPQTWSILGMELPEMSKFQKIGLVIGAGVLISGLAVGIFGGGGIGSLITSLVGGGTVAWALGAFNDFLGEGGGLPDQQQQPSGAASAAQESIVGQAEAAATEAAPVAPAPAPSPAPEMMPEAPGPDPAGGLEAVAPGDAEGPAAEPDDRDLMTQLNVNNPWIRAYGGADGMLNEESEVKNLVTAWLKDPKMDPLVKRLASQMPAEQKQKIIAGLQEQNQGITGWGMPDDRVAAMIQILQT